MTATGVLISGILIVIAGLALVYRYRELLKRRPAYAVLTGVALLSVAGFIVFIDSGTTSHEYAGVNIDQNPGVVEITMVNFDSGSNLDSVGVVGPNGTRSTTMRSFGDRTTITLRSNEGVISYLNDPGNNITVLTTAGMKTVENVAELPFEYRKAPAGFVDPDADIGNYDNASVATVACLYNSTASFELGGRRVPANVSIPCNTPVLAQNDSVMVGTSMKPSSGTNADKVLTSPITLRSGEYHLIGTVDGNENVVQSFEVTEEIAQE